MRGRKEKPTKKELVELYTNQGLTIDELTTHFQASTTTVLRWMKGYDIPRRHEKNGGRKSPPSPPKAELIKRHQSSTMTDMQKHYGVSHPTMKRWLAEAGIQPRNTGQGSAFSKRLKQHKSKLTMNKLLGATDVFKNMVENRPIMLPRGSTLEITLPRIIVPWYVRLLRWFGFGK